jgi:hypothetical protein
MQEGELKPLDWVCAGQSFFMMEVCAVITLAYLVFIESNLGVVLFRPIYKPISVYLDMIHESI